MIFHIPRFRSFLADGGIEKSSGGVIVCFDVCWTLAVVKFLKGDTNWDSGSAIMMKGACLGLCRRCHYITESYTFCEDGPIGGRLGYCCAR